MNLCIHETFYRDIVFRLLPPLAITAGTVCERRIRETILITGWGFSVKYLKTLPGWTQSSGKLSADRHGTGTKEGKSHSMRSSKKAKTCRRCSKPRSHLCTMNLNIRRCEHNAICFYIVEESIKKVVCSTSLISKHLTKIRKVLRFLKNWRDLVDHQWPQFLTQFDQQTSPKILWHISNFAKIT